MVRCTYEGYTDDNFKPDIQNLESVQYYLYGTLTPNRKTSYKEFQVLDNAGALDEASGSFSGQGIREMEHAFSAAGYPVNKDIRHHLFYSVLWARRNVRRVALFWSGIQPLHAY